MPARDRSRTLSTTTSTPVRVIRNSDGAITGSVAGGSGVDWYEETSDVTMSPPYDVDHTFLSVDKKVTPVRIYGQGPYSIGGYTVKADGFNPTNRALYQYCPTVSSFATSYWVTKALANMNPNRPDLDLPLFLFEFKDFPRMLHDLGRILLRRKPKYSDFPGQYLAWSFGWDPLVRDLMALFDIQKSIEKRIAFLLKLEKGGHFRRSLFDDDVIDTTTTNGYTASMFNYTYRADTRTREHWKIWFTANAKLLTSLPDNRPVPDLARDLVLGLSVRPDLLWNMLPWSWLIDYFANIGDFMSANSGYVRSKVTRLCLMAHIVDQVETLPGKTSANHFIGTLGNLQTDIKRRSVHPNPTARISFDPFLTNGQMANLGALVVSKALQALGK
jgi:hypothetical protein